MSQGELRSCLVIKWRGVPVPKTVSWRSCGDKRLAGSTAELWGCLTRRALAASGFVCQEAWRARRQSPRERTRRLAAVILCYSSSVCFRAACHVAVVSRVDKQVAVRVDGIVTSQRKPFLDAVTISKDGGHGSTFLMVSIIERTLRRNVDLRIPFNFGRWDPVQAFQSTGSLQNYSNSSPGRRAHVS